MANQHITRYSTSKLITETPKQHFSATPTITHPLGSLKFRKSNNPKCGGVHAAVVTDTLLVEVCCTAALEKHLPGSYKSNIHFQYDLAISLRGIYLREIKTYVTKNLVHNVHSNFIHNIQKLK